jgi:hypothetical protein
MTNSDL